MSARVTRDVEFARRGDNALLLDLYLPDAPVGQVPVVLFVHGGGWVFGDRTAGASERAEALVAHGIAVASIDYRLAPDHTYPAQLDDVRDATRWLRGNGSELGLDTDRIGAWGISAGGHLAALLGLDPGDDAARVQAVVCYFPTTDLLASGARSSLEREYAAGGTEGALLGVADVSDDLALARAASPRHQVSDEAPPFLLVHGDRDQMVSVDQSRWFHDTLVAAGQSSNLLIVGGAGHEAELFERPSLVAYVAGFFAEHLAG